jgi:NADPH-dependent curcumin reductase CurA
VKLKQYCPRIGLPSPEQEFNICKNVPVPKISEVRDGYCLVKNLYLSMDPAMRGWMTDMKGSYLPPLNLGSVMRGGSVGLVVFSKSTRIKAGDYVNCNPDAVGWAQYGISSDTLLTKIIPRDGIPIRAYAGILGGTGLTAYFGLLAIGKPQSGQTVLISAAAGAGE